MTPLQFVTRQRIARAQQLIRETSRTQIDIALEVGYTSPSHFAQVFRRETGFTPSDYRRQKSCEFTARAAPSFTQGPDFSGVFASDISPGKLKTKRDLTIAPK